MKYKKIPNTDLEVSEICLGSMNWGQQNTEEDAHRQLDYALSQGINFIDTAEVYPIPVDPAKQGTTERYIGSWLEKTGNRKKIILATKVCVSTDITTRDTGTIPHYDRKSIREAIDGSLSRLKTDYIDIYQIHWPERKTNFFGIRGYKYYEKDESTKIEETLEALNELVKEGKVRYIGVSNETPWGVSEYLRIAKEKGYPRIVTIQNQYSLLNRTFEIGLAEIVTNEHIGFLPYSPLSMGVLSGKYLGGAKPEKARFTVTKRNSERYNPEHAQVAIARYVEIAKKYNLDPSQMALAFVLSRPFNTSVIIGATTIEQLSSDIKSADLVLSDEVLNEIESVYKEIPDPTV
ncbi:MAG: NADP(H)-dependent aldo-keto reductase [Patescibacteria group bacterium]|nr:NADP(H)-dependent aldo-keto reductase [Patescibacteria group bacterium]